MSSLWELCAAVQDARRYLDRFTRHDYTKAFKEYTERFAPLYLQAAGETDGGDEAAARLAESLLDTLEDGWKEKKFWNRSAVRVNEKQMMVDYLSPMLMGLEDPRCPRLAEALRDGWGRRWPKDAYRIATYSEIKGGFRNVILGIEMPNRQREEERK